MVVFSGNFPVSEEAWLFLVLFLDHLFLRCCCDLRVTVAFFPGFSGLKFIMYEIFRLCIISRSSVPIFKPSFESELKLSCSSM